MTPNIEILNLKVEVARDRLDKYITSQLKEYSRSKIQKLIENSLVEVNACIVADCSFQVKEGDDILIKMQTTQVPTIITAKNIPFEVVFEDDDMMVINKPAGLTVHPGAGNHDDTLVNALAYHCKNKLADTGDPSRPGIIHRLDKDTSGLMLIAKTVFAHSKLTKAIANHDVKRVYHALIYGTLIPAIGTIDTPYGRSKVDRKKMSVKYIGGKQAITHYKILTVHRATLSEIECKLETGRTHQIRVHMEYKKTPIIGDQTYGRSKNYNLAAFSDNVIKQIKSFPRQALHAKKIGFTHPRTDEYMEFESELPQDIRSLLEALDD
jgi:23S rRNA pseudouridine1911/1915/1917 synthase